VLHLPPWWERVRPRNQRSSFEPELSTDAWGRRARIFATRTHATEVAHPRVRPTAADLAT
jgi:hypothetical protein